MEAGTDFYSTSAADTLLAACVATTGNETVAGVKTFSSFPATPNSAPTTDYQVANKKYVDDNSGGSASISDAVYDSSWDGDTTNGASKNAIYDKIETLAGGHDAVTLATGINALTLSTQEIGVDAAVEGLADATLPSAKAVYYYNGSSYEWATSLGVDIVLYDESPDTPGQLTYDAATNALELYSTSTVRTFSDDAAIAGVATITASGFDGNLATTDDTIQEVAQALDDLSSSLADNAVTNAKMADDAIDSAEIVDGAVDADHLSDGIKQRTKSFVIGEASTDDDFLLWKTPVAITITHINGVLLSGTNVVGGLDECDSAGANPAVVDADITFNGGNDADDGTLTNPSIDANDWVKWHTTSVSSPGFLTVTVTYEVN